ncbi:MAG TPA: ABATE domain-containing protein [Phytomonospora sp.]
MEIKKEPALVLALTIRHDGDGGVADDLADVAGLAEWLSRNADVLGDGHDADEPTRRRVVGIRRAVRALFAHAVRPGPASAADRDDLMPLAEAVAAVNAAARAMPVVPVLADDGRTVTPSPVDGRPLTALLAHEAIAFLGGPKRALLRACTAPRCVRYFLKEHNRQQWCKTSCGNRARAARHYQKQRGGHKTPTHLTIR